MAAGCCLQVAFINEVLVRDKELLTCGFVLQFYLRLAIDGGREEDGQEAPGNHVIDL